jgi:hypothetical protein
MNITAQKRSLNTSRAREGLAGIPQGEVDHCSTYYLLYESNCSEAGATTAPERWCSTGLRWTTVLHIIYLMNLESDCSEAEPQLHQSRRRMRWCSTWGRWTTVLHIIYLMYLESNCSEAEPQLHQSQRRTRWCFTGGGGRLFYLLFT